MCNAPSRAHMRKLAVLAGLALLAAVLVGGHHALGLLLVAAGAAGRVKAEGRRQQAAGVVC